MKKILITGGTGLIGSQLIPQLKSRGFEVVLLSRTPRIYMGCPSFNWNVNQLEIDSEALAGVTDIIHLAGAGIADKRWTSRRKKEVLDSRVKSADLLLTAAKQVKAPLQSFISASGISFYGTKTSEKIFTESDPPANEFIADVCVKWEAAADQFENICRVVKLRTGVVLAKNGGAFEKLAQPIKFGVGAALGSGRQIMPYIHIEDLVNLYIYCLENEGLDGVYNAVNNDIISNAQLTKAIAKKLNRPLILPNIPKFFMKFLLGDVAEIVLGGSPVSANKIIESGFDFKFLDIESTLNDIV